MNAMKQLRQRFAHFRKTPGLKVTLVGGVLVTITTTAAIVYFPWSLMSRRNVDSLIAQSNQEITLATSKEVERLFRSAQSAQQLIQSSYVNNFVNLEDRKAQEAFLLSALRANPDFTWVQLGYANGDFLGAQRTTDGLLNFHIRDWDAASKTTSTIIRSYKLKDDQMIRVQTQSKQMNPPFFAPQRPWYQNSLKAPGKPTWTVYVYRSTNAPGMDATITLNQQGKILGVVGVGIGLQQLSEYLQRLQEERKVEAFIINSQNELIASTNPKDVVVEPSADQSQPTLPKFNSTDNPLLQYANQTFQAEQLAPTQIQSWQKFTYTDTETGDRYFISLAPLGHLDWYIGTVIPESNYTAEIERNKQILFVVITGFIIITAGLAVLLIDRIIARPLLRVTDAAAAIEAQKFEPDCLANVAQRTDELGQLARVFQTMARQIYVREQKLKQQVQELRIEIDEVKRQKQVKEIVETDFFQDLVSKAHTLRKRNQPKTLQE